MSEGMHKILIRKAGQANGGTGTPFNMKVVKFKEHVVSQSDSEISNTCIISLFVCLFVYYCMVLGDYLVLDLPMSLFLNLLSQQ